MEPESNRSTENGTFLYQAEVDSSRNLSDYTVRVIPYHENLAVPLETNCIYWQR